MGTLGPEFFLLVVAVVSALAGALITWLIGYVNREQQRHPPPSTAAQAEPGDYTPADARELLRVSRTKKGLAVFVQGQRYRHLREVADSQVGRETIEALKATLAFSEGWLPTPQRAPSHPAPEESTVDQETFLDQLRQSDLFPSGGSPRSGRDAGPYGTMSEPLQPGPLPLVEEIDDLVQQRLRERPELAGQPVRLTSGAGGGLRIYVGLQSFDSVDEIPNPQVRALIRDAIREWESG